jgi:hypothetical protein
MSRRDEFMPGDRVRNTNYGVYGVVLDVRSDEIKVRWNVGRRAPVWTSDVECIKRLRVPA